MRECGTNFYKLVVHDAPSMLIPLDGALFSNQTGTGGNWKEASGIDCPHMWEEHHDEEIGPWKHC